MLKTTNEFVGKTVAIAGRLTSYTIGGLKLKLDSLGAIVVSTVTRKTNYLIVGTNPGKAYEKAENLGIRIRTEAEFDEMLEQK